MAGSFDWGEVLSFVLMFISQSLDKKVELQSTVGEVHAEKEIVDRPDSQCKPHK